MRSKRQDPLHVLLEYIATVSAAGICYIFTLILTWTVQRAPDCDMVLVHDDDLARILQAGDGNVSTGHL